MAVYSNQWYRVASLRPRLSPQVQVRRQLLRGETWFVLADEVTGRSVRLNRGAYALAGRFNGRLTVQQLWDGLQQLPDEPATQDEVVDLLARLRESTLVDFDRPADFATLLPHLDTVRRQRTRFNPIAWRLPLGNPSAALEWLRPFQLLFSRTGLWLWLACVALLVVLGAQHLPQLWDHALRAMATPRYALLALLLYAPIKLVHEFTHGVAVRRWGGAVHEAGVTLMMGMPVPYVNASAASSFPEVRHRIAVSAAGIMSELAMATAALLLWLNLNDGLAREVAFVTLVITSVSTLFFNANPLQRLDGYYILADALQLPNLASRSRAWWSDLLRRRLLRLPELEPMPLARGERPWLVAYAPLAWLYAIVITAAAVVWLGHMSLALGIVAGAGLAFLLVLRPAAVLIGELRRAAQSQRAAAGRMRLTLALLGIGLIAVLAVPLPRHQLARGVVWPPDRAQVRTDTAGFVATLHRRDGERVRRGDALLELANPQLRADHARQLARVAGIESELFQALTSDPAAAAKLRGELGTAQAELAQIVERLDGLVVRAQVDGRLALPAAADLATRYVQRGQLLGQVLTGEPPTVRVALPEDEARDLRRAARTVSVRMADARSAAWPAQLLRDSVGAVPTLPNAALSERHGGDIATDPQDSSATQTLRPVVLLDVRLAAGDAANERIGTRAWVRFDEGRAPLAQQLLLWGQRQIARRFNPQF